MVEMRSVRIERMHRAAQRFVARSRRLSLQDFGGLHQLRHDHVQVAVRIGWELAIGEDRCDALLDAQPERAGLRRRQRP